MCEAIELNIVRTTVESRSSHFLHPVQWFSESQSSKDWGSWFAMQILRPHSRPASNLCVLISPPGDSDRLRGENCCSGLAPYRLLAQHPRCVGSYWDEVSENVG